VDPVVVPVVRHHQGVLLPVLLEQALVQVLVQAPAPVAVQVLRQHWQCQPLELIMMMRLHFIEKRPLLPMTAVLESMTLL
jgi:hypothetical protein